MPSDERITRLLATALDPGDRQPPEERVAALRAHVLAAPPQRRPMVLRRAAVGFAVLAALGGGVVIGHDLPRPMRTAARAVGLDFVESPTLVDAREELDRLGRALSQKQWNEVIAADRAMLRFVEKLDEKEKAKIVPVAHEVHVQAIETLREVGVCPKTGPCPPAPA
jgi:hypothetical protein